MIRFLSQMARAVAHIFAPTESDLVQVGFQPITDDVFKIRGSTCYAGNYEDLRR